jgi:2,4-dienoyl-CoA reductase-like NADH-dependent reductase (Old Yellow Enzyme family)
VEDSVALAKVLKSKGVDVIDCSSGNIRAGDRYKMEPGWQVPLAERVRAGADVMTAAVGLISDPHQADDIIRSGKADIVLLARQMMREPHWPLRAATELGLPVTAALPRIYSYAL